MMEVVAVEDVVAKYQGRKIVADELLADDESLCKAIRTKVLSKCLKQSLNKIFNSSKSRLKTHLCLYSMNKI